MRSRLARGIQPADLVLKNCQVIAVFSRSPAECSISTEKALFVCRVCMSLMTVPLELRGMIFRPLFVLLSAWTTMNVRRAWGSLGGTQGRHVSFCQGGSSARNPKEILSIINEKNSHRCLLVTDDCNTKNYCIYFQVVMLIANRKQGCFPL